MLDVGRGEKGHAVDIIILIMNASIQTSKNTCYMEFVIPTGWQIFFTNRSTGK